MVDGGQLRFTLAPAADDAEVQIEFSSDLQNWQSAELPLVSRTGQTLVYNILPIDSPRKFYRLTVSVSAP